MSKSDTLENSMLDHVLGGPDYTRDATVYIGIYTAPPTDAGGGTEISTGGGSLYARVAMTNNLTNWPAASSGQKSNGTEILFPTAGTDWGLISAFSIMSAASGGAQRYWGLLVGTQLTFFANDSDDLLYIPGHAFVADDKVVLEALGLGGQALPTGLSAATEYFARDVSGDTLKLAATLGGSAINVTADGMGLIGLSKFQTILTGQIARFDPSALVIVED